MRQFNACNFPPLTLPSLLLENLPIHISTLSTAQLLTLGDLHAVGWLESLLGAMSAS